jgi:hypothetical protein
LVGSKAGAVATAKFRQTYSSDYSRVFTAFLPFCRQKAGSKNGRKAERQNDSAAAETFLPRQQQISAAPDLPRKFPGFRV